MMDMVVPGKRRRERPRLRWIDNNREDSRQESDGDGGAGERKERKTKAEVNG